MSFFEDDEEPTGQERESISERRRPRRRPPSGRGPSPLARVVVILVAVVVLVLITSLMIKSCLGNKRVEEYRKYFAEVESITRESDEIGRQLTEMFQKPDESVRKSMQGKLAEMTTASLALVERAKSIEAPDQFKQENEWLVASLQIRYKGLDSLHPDLLNAMEAKPENTSTVANDVLHDMLILMSSDVTYQEFFVAPAEKALGDEKITEVKVPRSEFIKDKALIANQQTIISVIERLKGGAEVTQVTGLHGVEILSVKVKPSGMTLAAGSENELKASDVLTFEVEVKNGGEATETGVPVVITLTMPGREEQKIEGRIDSIGPEQVQVVELSGLAADAGDQQALLRAQAGPVPGETKTDNNIQEFTILFR